MKMSTDLNSRFWIDAFVRTGCCFPISSVVGGSTLGSLGRPLLPNFGVLARTPHFVWQALMAGAWLTVQWHCGRNGTRFYTILLRVGKATGRVLPASLDPTARWTPDVFSV